MKTNIIKVLLLITMTALSAASSFAQTTVEFSYDANGNRILRQIAVGGGKNITDGKTQEADPAVDEFASLTVMLYPNPTDGLFSVAVSGDGAASTLQAMLVTPSGAIIQDAIIIDQRADFDLRSYPAGLYLLKLSVGDESHVWKIIKK